jgi:phage major head subunit gpT-like protein
MIIDTIALTRGLKVIFNKALSEIPINTGLLNLATRSPSNGSSETYGWLGDVPMMREWVGQKHAKGLKDYSYTLTNQDWEATLEVDRNELEDDQYGMIPPRVQMLAQAAREHDMILLSDLIINGTSDLAYDSVAFFSNVSGDRVIDNLLAGSGVTLANLETDLAAARTAMMKFYFDESDRKYGFKMDTVVCPPELEILFMKILESTTAVSSSAAGIVNPFRNILKQVIVDPRLSDADDWYGFGTTYPLKPLIFQDRKAIELKSLVEGSDVAFSYKKYQYSAESRNTAGYGFPHMAVKIVN